MKRIALLLLFASCCALRAEFPPADEDNSEDVRSAIGAGKDDSSDSDEPRAPSSRERDLDRNNPFSGRPDEDGSQPGRRLVPRTRLHQNQTQKRKPVQPLDREPSDTEEPSDVEEAEVIRKPTKDPATVALSLYSGINLSSTSNASINTERGNEGLNTQYPLGLHADLRAFRFFGAELDGYYSYQPTQSVYASGSSSSSSSTTAAAQKQLQAYGVEAVAKVFYPFDRHRQFKWYPGIGVGYGFETVRQSATISGSSETDTLAASGPVISVGTQLIPGPDWIFDLDLVYSLGASGTLTSAPSGSTATVATGGATFYRLRVAGLYQVAQGFFLGAVVNYRVLQASTTGSSTSTGGALSGFPATAPTGDPESQIQVALTGLFAF